MKEYKNPENFRPKTSETTGPETGGKKKRNNLGNNPGGSDLHHINIHAVNGLIPVHRLP